MAVASQLRTERELVEGLGANVLLGYWDKDRVCRFANSTYSRWFDISPEQLVGSHVTEHMGTTYERNRARFEAALRGEPQQFECTIAGTPPRHCLANYLPDIVDGAVRGFYVMTYDVSELKQSQQNLAATEATFSQIIDLAGDAIISIDEHRKIRVFNASAEEIYGYRAAEVLGRDVVMFGPERFRDEYAAAVDRFMTNLEAPSVLRATSGIGRRNNGDEFPIEVTQSRFQVGGATQVTFLVRDITERVRAEREQRVLAETGAVLAASLEYKQTLQAIANLIVKELADSCAIDSLSADGKTIERLTVAHANPEKVRILEELVTLRKERRFMLSHHVFDTGQPKIFETMDLPALSENEKHAHALQRLGTRSAMVVPLVMHGTMLGALIFGSERPRRYSAADVPLATELARRAAIAINNARLYEAEQRATHARDEILEIVAHDLRSPLNSILLGAQLLRYINIPDAIASAEIESIVRSTQWANRLIEDLLDVRRIEGGVLSITPAKVSPRDAIMAALSMHHIVATAAGIVIRQDISVDVQDVWADRDRLRQVLENLIGNAVKFTSAGGHILVGAHGQEGSVRFYVSDTGAGIPEANLEKVFDRFWQASRTERRGAGLGLPICKGIVEKHGGRIWATSSPGQGTTFQFTLPIALP